MRTYDCGNGKGWVSKFRSGFFSASCARFPLGFALIFVSLFATAGTADASEPIVLSKDLTSMVLGEKMLILEDPLGEFTIEDVSTGSQSGNFGEIKDGKTNLGFTKSVFWVRFELENQNDFHRNVLLELDNAILDEITLFRQNAYGEYRPLTLGDHHPFEDREIPNRNPVFDLQVGANSTTVYFARLFTDGSMSIALVMHDPHVFYKSDHNQQIAFGVYFGIVLVMGLYNLFLFFAVRDPAYIYYVLFILGVSLFNATISGLAYEYILHAIPLPFFVHKALLYFVVLIGGPGCLFTMSFLKTRETAPLLHKFLVGFTLMFVFLFVAVVVGPYGPISKIAALVTVTWSFVLTGTGIYILLKGYSPARFYVLAWVALLVGCLLQASRLLGLLPNMFITMYGMEIGSAIEVVLLSLALADRIAIMKKEKEIAQREAIDTLKRTDRIKNEFLANTSHELRTPLNGIIGIAESLMQGAVGKLGKKANENLGMIVSAGQRLSALVNDILDFSKIREHNLDLQLKPVALKQVVDLEIALLSPLVGARDLVIKNEIPEDFTAVSGDENRLIQIFQNVIGNSIKFTESGSVTVSARLNNEMVEVKISDTGVGVPADKLDDIFIAFEQGDGSTARKFGGTGIGLSITKKLVELHGGTITVESEVGVGTTMTITLQPTDEKPDEAGAASAADFVARPIHAALDEASDQDDSPVDVVPVTGEKGIHILAVDDEPLNLRVLTNQLTMHGHKVSLARDGAEALQIVEKDGKPDLVLLDVMMPKMTGLEVCNKLREKYNATELPIILLTAKNQLADLLSGFNVGANDYLTKPFSSREVLARIKVQSQISEYAAALGTVNEELRIQIVKRSEQLFSTLAMIGKGVTEVSVLEPGKVLAERYEIKRFAGEGGMGSVYEATVLATGERAALKVAKSGDPIALALLAQEARMGIEVVHDNVVRVLDVDIAQEGFLYVVMEFLDGPTLSESKERWGDIGWGLEVLRQVSLGLSELHSHNIVHRDLKPANLVIAKQSKAPGFSVKIVDFGISSWQAELDPEEISKNPESVYIATSSRPPGPMYSSSSAPHTNDEQIPSPFSDEFAMGEDTVAPKVTKGGIATSTKLTNDQAGTPKFMAPEQLGGGAPAGQSTDVWAVGVIAWRVLANGWPLTEENLSDFLTGMGTANVASIRDSLPELNPKVLEAIDSCLDLDPRKRPSASKLAQVFLEATKK